MTQKFRILGLMSGTSLDGIDLALVEFGPDIRNWTLLKAHTLSYPQTLREQLDNICRAPAPELLSFHLKYGKYLGDIVNIFIDKWQIKPDLIASHGHTIFHEPDRPLTFALGHGGIIHQVSGIPVVSDFRSEDVGTGGQGAPLVPLGDQLLFPDYDICLNLGGFSNISYNDAFGNRMAGDVCAVNLVFNHLASQLGQPFDPDGRMAASGKMLPELLAQLNNLPFYRQPFPRAFSREMVEASIFPIFPENASIPDLLHTYGHHAALVLADALRANGPGSVLITGGGTYNQWFMELLQRFSGMELIRPAQEIIDFKEAIIFAALGFLRAKGEVNVLASATGNRQNRICGALHGGKIF